MPEGFWKRFLICQIVTVGFYFVSTIFGMILFFPFGAFLTTVFVFPYAFMFWWANSGAGDPITALAYALGIGQSLVYGYVIGKAIDPWSFWKRLFLIFATHILAILIFGAIFDSYYKTQFPR
jgi:hypothetical protein